MKFSAKKSSESCHIKVCIDIGMDEIMSNGVMEVAISELIEAFNADVSARDKLILLDIISKSKKAA